MSQIAPLNIGVFGVRDVPSTYSGFETFLTTLLPELVDRGHQVTIYTRGEVGPRPPFRGVRRFGTGALRTKQLDTLTHSWTAAGRSWRSRHDVLLVCNVATVAPVAALRLLGIRSVLNVDGQEWQRGKWGRIGRAYFRLSARGARFASPALVTDCNAMADVFTREFRSASTVIPYCQPAIERTGDDGERLAALGLESRSFVFTGGRLVPENNIERIVSAYLRTDIGLPLAVAGSANYASPVQRSLDAAASEDSRVRLLGHVVDRLTFLALLEHARAYLHGHSVGGINPSMVEAMSVGANVLALDTAFNREALGDTGRFFTDPDHDLASKLREVLATPAQISDQRRSRAAVRARAEFEIQDVVGAYEGLLSRVARESFETGYMRTRWTR